MDRKLVAWARAVKARRRWSAATRAAPTLFLFLDDRLADPVGAVASLGLSLGAAGRGLFGVVLRARDAGARAALARRIAPLCRRHDLALVIAGDPRLARAWRAGCTGGAAGGPAPGGSCPRIRGASSPRPRTTWPRCAAPKAPHWCSSRRCSGRRAIPARRRSDRIVSRG